MQMVNLILKLGGGFDKTWSQLKDTDEATVHLYTDIGTCNYSC